jgi:hypothetical protein
MPTGKRSRGKMTTLFSSLYSCDGLALTQSLPTASRKVSWEGLEFGNAGPECRGVLQIPFSEVVVIKPHPSALQRGLSSGQI